MAKQRVSEDGHKISGAEASRRHEDRLADITDDLIEARKKIDIKRKEEAEKDIVKWVETYCVGLVLQTNPPTKGKEILEKMVEACTTSPKPILLEMMRGFGKTSLSVCVILYLIVSKQRQFPVIVGNNARAAQQILTDFYIAISTPDTNLAQDYPDFVLPFTLLNGSFRRRQIINGVSTSIVKNASEIHLPLITEEDGKSYQAFLCTRGITGTLRGLKLGKCGIRPDVVLLDDIQDDESASSPEQIQKIVDIINKSIFNLSGKGSIACLACLTPIADGDLCSIIEANKNWITLKYPAIIHQPKDVIENPNNGLWATYRKMYETELTQGISHDESLKYHRTHYKEMLDGCELLAPDRYKISDGHISGYQALLCRRLLIGDDAFNSEMMMISKKPITALDISPQDILSHIDERIKEYTLPDGHQVSILAIDLNTSYALSWVIMSAAPDGSTAVIAHGLYKCTIDQSLPEVQYAQEVYKHLSILTKDLSSKMKIDYLVADCGGKNWNAVHNFSRNSKQICGIQCCPCAGRSSLKLNLYPRNKLRNPIERTILVGDETERLKAGSGQKWFYFDSDFYRETAHRSFKLPLGAIGSCSLYYGSIQEHNNFSIQVTNEKLKLKKLQPDGRELYIWNSKESHDYLDCMSMARATLAQIGLGASNLLQKSMQTTKPHRQALIKQLAQKKKKIRFV